MYMCVSESMYTYTCVYVCICDINEDEAGTIRLFVGKKTARGNGDKEEWSQAQTLGSLGPCPS